jgi:aryl-alcohol dehydrogenase-like predicted oxidoreductase
LIVSEIALGSWRTFGGGLDKEESSRCIQAAVDEGINLFDTANVYARGEAESIIGESLQHVSRTRYVLATKLFFPMSDTDYGLSRKQIFKQLDASLRRLRTDYIDLYQCHRYDSETPLEETMEALSEVVGQGKVRYIGFSEWPVEKVDAAMNLPGVERFVSSQPQYSLLWRQPERALFPMCRKYGISQIVWAPLAEGVLTGKYLPQTPPSTQTRAGHPYMGKQFQQEFLRDSILEAVQALKLLAHDHGLSLPQLALAWVLRNQYIASAITGATTPHQIVENVKASGIIIEPSLFKHAERIIEYGQERIGPDPCDSNI